MICFSVKVVFVLLLIFVVVWNVILWLVFVGVWDEIMSGCELVMFFVLFFFLFGIGMVLWVGVVFFCWRCYGDV